MQVTIEATTIGYPTGGVYSISVNVTTTSGFVVLVASAQSTITSATCEGVPMNLARTSSGGNQTASIYYLGGLTPGTKTLKVNFGGYAESFSVGYSLAGVDLVSPLGGTGGVAGTSGTPYTSCGTTLPGGLVIDVMKGTAVPEPSNPSPTTGQTLTYSGKYSSYHAFASAREDSPTGGGSTPVGYSPSFSHGYALAAAEFRAAPEVTGVSNKIISIN